MSQPPSAPLELPRELRLLPNGPAMPSTVWYEPGSVHLLDQTRLPEQVVVRRCTAVADVVEAIVRLRVRGAPAIGVAAAHAVVLAADLALADGQPLPQLRERVVDALGVLRTARPTAVNLGWAVTRMARVLERCDAGTDAAATAPSVASQAPRALRDALAAEAAAIHHEDVALCRALSAHGAVLLPARCTVMTHCNAGALATAGMGTALGIVYAATAAGKQVEVLVRETRPLLQGARLTAWELARNGIAVTLLCDDAAGWLFRTRHIDAVVVGADRIAANGDVANKVGTYPLAALAARHGVPFYVAAPYSTLDLSIARGEAIPIEERAGDEVSPHWSGGPVRIANPAFDVTPAELVTAIVTERGVLRAPLPAAIATAYGRG